MEKDIYGNLRYNYGREREAKEFKSKMFQDELRLEENSRQLDLMIELSCPIIKNKYKNR